MAQPAEIMVGVLLGEEALSSCPSATQLTGFCRQVVDVRNGALLLSRIFVLLVTFLKGLEALDSAAPFPSYFLSSDTKCFEIILKIIVVVFTGNL